MMEILEKLDERITPACAGKSHGVSSTSPMKWDHPRMCGEKAEEEIHRNRDRGSPPHVRGKVIYALHYCAQGGITPACAGKSFFCPNRILWDKDHPRMCGEKSLCDQLSLE